MCWENWREPVRMTNPQFDADLPDVCSRRWARFWAERFVGARRLGKLVQRQRRLERRRARWRWRSGLRR